MIVVPRMRLILQSSLFKIEPANKVNKIAMLQSSLWLTTFLHNLKLLNSNLSRHL